MKKLLLIILTSSLVLSAYAQADQHWLPKKLSISVKEMPLEEVLKKLEKELNGVVFAYSPGAFDVKKKVTIEASEVPLNEILHRVFVNQNLECAEMRGKIFLKKKKNPVKQGTSPVRRKRASRASVRKASSSMSQPADQKASVALPGKSKTEADPVKTTSVGKKVSSSKQSLEEQPQKKTTALRPSPAIMALVEEMTAPDRVRSASARNTVVPIQRKTSLADFDDYRAQSFDKPVIPPMPVDTTGAALGLEKPGRVKKKKDKKEKPPREPEEKKLRLYGASTTALTAMGGDAAIKLGGRAVWLKNSRFGIGLAGYALQGSSQADPVLANNNYKLAGGYGGLLLEYNLNPNKAIHLSFPVVIAGGAMTYVHGDLDSSTILPLIEDQRVVAIVEPGAMLELNVVKFMKVAFDVSYRYASHSELNYEDTGEVILAGSGLNNFSGGVTVKFGIF